VKHIAKLARLGLSDKEIGKFQKELSSILDYVEKLKKVDVSGVQATSHPLEVNNVVREDKPRKWEVESERLIEMAPDKKNGYVKVKSILR
ncbi:MAG: Asp-tRNA(Asn)/Glu-tRNA(Gln) amidotransferase subunit GatC, partial [bacterium]|nr:Asp-tRNA(Asn)/Glu-tRNA(Gln) amidotransferase subunit GatC [bacterium]